MEASKENSQRNENTFTGTIERSMINIRASMLSSYSDCPRRAAAGQFKEVIEGFGYNIKKLPSRVGATLGTSVHAGTKFTIDKKISTGLIAINTSDAIDISINKYDELSNDGVEYDTVTPGKNDAQKQIIQLVNSFHSEIAPNINPLSTETFRKNIVTEDITISGSSDIETKDNSIDDIKSGAVMRPCQVQLGLYSILKGSEKGNVFAKATRQIWLPRTALKKSYPGAQVFSYDINLCHKFAYTMVFNIARDIKNFIKSQNPWCFPVNPMSVLCSEKWCPCYKTNFCEVYK
jgi:hypothetical protein